MAEEAISPGGPPADSGWQQTRRLTLWLLALWFGTTFVSLFFARELSGVTLLGWPVPFYMAALGLPLLYLFIIVLYAWRMRQIERDQHVERRQ